MRLRTLSIGLLAAACAGGSGAAPVPTAGPPPPAPAATAPPSFDGPPAPDFTLTLENRSRDFQLSDELKPVYMVFWAEW